MTNIPLPDKETNSVYSVKQRQSPIDSFINLLYDDELEEIMYIGQKSTVKVIHRKQGMCDTDFKMNQADANKMIEKILDSSYILDKSANIINTSLSDGSRINIMRGGIVAEGPVITIRKFKQEPITVIDLIKNQSISVDFAAFMWMCIEGLNMSPSNIIFCGGTSSGKTTLLNAFSIFVPKYSRIITIEDCLELRVIHPHLVSLESTEKISMQRLVKATLRMRPDRMIIGEVRDKEAQDLFTAMNVGYSGCMGTLHSNSSRETITRITNRPMDVPLILLRNLDLIVMQKRRLSNGRTKRYISEVSEISGSEGENPLLNTIFSFNTTSNCLEKTNVPSRTRAKIVGELGITIFEFERIFSKRKRILSLLAERSENFKNKELLEVFDKQSKHTTSHNLSSSTVGQTTDEPVQSNIHHNSHHNLHEKKRKRKQEDKSFLDKMGTFFEDNMF